MANLRASGVIKNRPLLYSEVVATSQYKNDIAFDSTLTVSENPNQNCKLRINLKIFLIKVVPEQVTDVVLQSITKALGTYSNRKVGYKADWDENYKLIKDWQGNEWNDFVRDFLIQAAKWNGKFWLIPPDDFPHFDIVQGKSVFRPNVACEFGIQIVYSPLLAHHTIEVVNLYNPNDSYRADNANYTSESVKPRQNWSQDRKLNWREHKNFSTVVHEIGHTLGLPHIGQTKSLPDCNLAIVFSQTMPKEAVPALYKGGIGANVCYGDLSTVGDADNVMGMGDKFAAENAKPWLDRLGHHFFSSIIVNNWKVSLNEVPPMSLVGFYKQTG